MVHKVGLSLDGKELSLESGRMAGQAHGAVLVQYGDTVVLATAVVAEEPREGGDFLPLTVNYLEKAYAAGKIPGGFFKREGRPGEKETLTSRLIDRTMRPLFPDNFYNETQVIIIVLSADQENDPDILALIGASAAITLSPIPFPLPVAGVRIGEENGNWVINPTYAQLEKSSVDIVIAGTEDAIVMVEGSANEIPEERLLEAIFFAHDAIRKVIQAQKQLRDLCGQPDMEVPVRAVLAPELEAKVRELALEGIRECIVTPDKQERRKKKNQVFEEVVSALGIDDEQVVNLVKDWLDKASREELRQLVLDKSVRADGRGLADLRQITCEVGVLPRTHGSALFTRGETQALAITTLGSSSDEQKIDALEGASYKSFMLHYNFPPFCVGEASFLRPPGRREIGHGNLAARSIKPVLPPEESFPYTIRIVSDILSSNGSSSMASVCGSSLSLMDAGVPIKTAVAGVAMGLIKEDDKVAVLSDILGLEDRIGDMDFKVAGTKTGITAIQMDIKIKGVTEELISQALTQAKDNRMQILKKMEDALPEPRAELSQFAPRIITTQVKPDKVRDVIGPGGKVIKSIVERTGAQIDIEDDGSIKIAAPTQEAAEEALKIINEITREVCAGEIFTGKVTRMGDSWVLVEILPRTEGLLHISQMAAYRVQRVEDEVKLGDKVTVKVIEVDRNTGRIKLSRKAVIGHKDSPAKGA